MSNAKNFSPELWNRIIGLVEDPDTCTNILPAGHIWEKHLDVTDEDIRDFAKLKNFDNYPRKIPQASRFTICSPNDHYVSDGDRIKDILPFIVDALKNESLQREIYEWCEVMEYDKEENTFPHYTHKVIGKTAVHGIPDRFFDESAIELVLTEPNSQEDDQQLPFGFLTVYPTFTNDEAKIVTDIIDEMLKN